MTNIAWGAIATLAVFVVSNIGLMIYWSARISTLLDIVQRDLKEIADEFKLTRGLYLSKEEFSYRVSQSDKEHAAMWKQIDELKR